MNAQTMAESARDEAVADSMVELKIDDKTKCAGATCLTIDGGAFSQTIGGARVVTGHMKENDRRSHSHDRHGSRG